ncbi:MAG: nicotinate-nucleotide adenylyltransferase [Candidatus Hydrogenedentota bacterium]
MRKIGVLGGSFDPVHIGHLHIADYALTNLKLDYILFVPDLKSPYKKTKKYNADYIRRLDMLKIAVKKERRFKVSEIAKKIKGYTYTIEVLKKLKKNFSDSDLYLILGLDSFYDLRNWKDYEEIIKSCRLVIFKRPGLNVRNIRSNDRTIFISKTEINISSSEIRKSILVDKSCRYLLPDGIFDYIKKNHLYGL